MRFVNGVVLRPGGCPQLSRLARHCKMWQVHAGSSGMRHAGINSGNQVSCISSDGFMQRFAAGLHWLYRVLLPICTISTCSRWQFTKKRKQKTREPMQRFAGFSGVAGNRTRVQTSNQSAFYTFISRLDFRHCAWPEAATQRLASKDVRRAARQNPS